MTPPLLILYPSFLHMQKQFCYILSVEDVSNSLFPLKFCEFHSNIKKRGSHPSLWCKRFRQMKVPQFPFPLNFSSLLFIRVRSTYNSESLFFLKENERKIHIKRILFQLVHHPVYSHESFSQGMPGVVSCLPAARSVCPTDCDRVASRDLVYV